MNYRDIKQSHALVKTNKKNVDFFGFLELYLI